MKYHPTVLALYAAHQSLTLIEAGGGGEDPEGVSYAAGLVVGAIYDELGDGQADILFERGLE